MFDTEVNRRCTNPAMSVIALMLQRAAGMGILEALVSGNDAIKGRESDCGENCEESVRQHGKECEGSVSGRRACTGGGLVLCGLWGPSAAVERVWWQKERVDGKEAGGSGNECGLATVRYYENNQYVIFGETTPCM